MSDWMHRSDLSRAAAVEYLAEFALESPCGTDFITEILVDVAPGTKSRPVRKPCSVRIAGLRELGPIRDHGVGECSVHFVGWKPRIRGVEHVGDLGPVVGEQLLT